MHRTEPSRRNLTRTWCNALLIGSDKVVTNGKWPYRNYDKVNMSLKKTSKIYVIGRYEANMLDESGQKRDEARCLV